MVIPEIEVVIAIDLVSKQGIFLTKIICKTKEMYYLDITSHASYSRVLWKSLAFFMASFHSSSRSLPPYAHHEIRNVSSINRTAPAFIGVMCRRIEEKRLGRCRRKGQDRIVPVS